MNTVLITGASGGIGSATARCFAKNGWHIALHYHQNQKSAQALEAELAPLTDVKAFCASLIDSAEADKLIHDVTANFGRIDALVNNAGISQQKLFTDLTDDDWSRMFRVNIDSVFFTSRAVLRQMIARHSGNIVNVSSIWGVRGASCEVHYSASKAAVIGLTKALSKEVGPSGIHVNCVAPGVIDTPMNACFDAETLQVLRDETPLGRLGTPKEIAELIFFLCSEKSSFLTGQIISHDGGFTV